MCGSWNVVVDVVEALEPHERKSKPGHYGLSGSGVLTRPNVR